MSGREGLRPYYAAKRNLDDARDRVGRLCQYAFALAELLHPGFLSGLKNAAEDILQKESEANRAAFEAERL